MPAIKDIDLAEFDSYEFATNSSPKPVKRDRVRFGKSQSFIVAQEKMNRILSGQARDVRNEELEAIEILRIEGNFKYQPDEGFGSPYAST